MQGIGRISCPGWCVYLKGLVVMVITSPATPRDSSSLRLSYLSRLLGVSHLFGFSGHLIEFFLEKSYNCPVSSVFRKRKIPIPIPVQLLLDDHPQQNEICKTAFFGFCGIVRSFICVNCQGLFWDFHNFIGSRCWSLLLSLVFHSAVGKG